VEPLLIKSLVSPISRGEWEKHHSIVEINNAHDDPEAIYIDAEPENALTYESLVRLFGGMQKELDLSWSVLGEVYGRYEHLNVLGITIRRIRSSLDNLEEFDYDQVIRVDLDSSMPEDMPPGVSDTGDNKIIACTLLNRKKHPDSEVILISKDINLRVKCDSLGVKSEDYLADHIEIPADKIYTGQIEVELTDDEIDEFYVNGKVKVKSLGNLPPNCFVIGIVIVIHLQL